MVDGQSVLWCGCGSERFDRRGLCPRCHGRRRHSLAKFAGQREQVLQRDDNQCQACGERADAQILVHHRRPGSADSKWQLTLCRACHARVHHIRRPGYGFVTSSPELFALWREVNQNRPVQRTLALCAPGGVPEAPQIQPALFD
jgi:hypothetical protein